MTTAHAIDWLRELLWNAVIIAGPAVLAAVVVGLIMSIFQAATQIHDQSVSFGPKILAVVAVLAAASPWMLVELTQFARVAIVAMSTVSGR